MTRVVLASEQRKQRAHEYYLKNSEKIKQRVREWHKNNHEWFLKRKEKYNAAHAVERNEKQKFYYTEHRDERAEYFQGYYSEKGEQVREHVNEMATIKKSEQREELGKVFDLKCYFCGEFDPMSKHKVSLHKKDGTPHNYHAIQRNQYAIEHPDEFAPLCRFCHRVITYFMAVGFVWEEIDPLLMNKRKELGEARMKQLRDELRARLRKHGKWLEKKEGVV